VLSSSTSCDPRSTQLAGLAPLLLAWCAVAQPASAGGTVETIRSQTVPLTATNWAGPSVSVPRVDPSLGRLVEVRVTFTATGDVDFRFENQSAAALAPIPVAMGLEIALFGGPGGELARASFSESGVLLFLPFDGTLDFVGPSGAIFARSFQQTIERRYFPGDPLADLFVGPAQNPGQVGVGSTAMGTAITGTPPGLFSLTPPPEAGVQWTIVVVQDLLDCNDNGIGDATDITSGPSSDLDGNEFPDECQGDHDGDGIPDTVDPNCQGVGPDADGDGILDVCDTTPDCSGDGIPDAFEVDRNHNGLDDACEFGTDCNVNGLPDALDLAAGISADLDRNSVPDECQSSSLGFYSESSCEIQDLCPGLVSQAGLSVELAYTGSCRLPENRVTLGAIRMQPGRTALLVGGASGFPAFALGGIHCVAGPRRLGARVAGADGTVTWQIDRAALELALGLQPWERVAFQVAYRHQTASGPVLAWSNALQVRYLP